MTAEGEAETREMQMALGQAISAWARIEGTLCHLFSYAVSNGGNAQPAVEAFCAVMSFETQLAMTRKAMETAFKGQKDILDPWEILRRRVDKLRESRNKLAHGQIVRVEKGDEWSVDFLPFFHEGTNKSQEAYVHWSVGDIRKIRGAFSDCAQKLWYLYFHLIRGETPPQLFPEPALQLGRSPASNRFRSSKPGSR